MRGKGRNPHPTNPPCSHCRHSSPVDTLKLVLDIILHLYLILPLPHASKIILHILHLGIKITRRLRPLHLLGVLANPRSCQFLIEGLPQSKLQISGRFQSLTSGKTYDSFLFQNLHVLPNLFRLLRFFIRSWTPRFRLGLAKLRHSFADCFEEIEESRLSSRCLTNVPIPYSASLRPETYVSLRVTV